MSMLETLQRYNTDKLERDRRLGKIPSAKILNFGNRVEKVSQEQPAPVPQPLPVVVEDPIQTREQRIETVKLRVAEFEKAPEAMREEIRDIARRPAAHNIKTIIDVVAIYYGVEVSQIKSDLRDTCFVRPRQIAMYISKQLTNRSLTHIGREFWRDHTTVMHGIRVTGERMKSDPLLKSDIEQITALLTPEASR